MPRLKLFLFIVAIFSIPIHAEQRIEPIRRTPDSIPSGSGGSFNGIFSRDELGVVSIAINKDGTPVAMSVEGQLSHGPMASFESTGKLRSVAWDDGDRDSDYHFLRREDVDPKNIPLYERAFKKLVNSKRIERELTLLDSNSEYPQFTKKKCKLVGEYLEKSGIAHLTMRLLRGGTDLYVEYDPDGAVKRLSTRIGDGNDLSIYQKDGVGIKTISALSDIYREEFGAIRAFFAEKSNK